MTPLYWTEATDYLASRDQIFADLILAYSDVSLTHSRNPFYTLIRSIIGQQISIKSTDSI